MMDNSDDILKKKLPRQYFLVILVGLLVAGFLSQYLFGDWIFGVAITLLLSFSWGLLKGYLVIPMRYPGHIIRLIMIAVMIFTVTTITAVLLLNQGLADPYKLLVATLPGIASLFLAYAIARAFASLDELQRRIQLEALAIAFGWSLVCVYAIGIYIMAGMDQPRWIYLLPMMVFGWLAGKLWTMWKYR
jgi:hypothetical protein